MKIAGFLLLIAGWILVLSAIVLLSGGGARNAFVAAGMGVEILGFVFAVRSHVLSQRSDRA